MYLKSSDNSVYLGIKLSGSDIGNCLVIMNVNESSQSVNDDPFFLRVYKQIQGSAVLRSELSELLNENKSVNATLTEESTVRRE